MDMYAVESHQTQRLRKANWTQDQSQLLLNLIAENKAVIKGGLSNNLTAKMKRETWEYITSQINAAYPHMVRTKIECERRWYVLQSRAKLKLASCQRQPTGIDGCPGKVEDLDVVSLAVYNNKGDNNSTFAGHGKHGSDTTDPLMGTLAFDSNVAALMPPEAPPKPAHRDAASLPPPVATPASAPPPVRRPLPPQVVVAPALPPVQRPLSSPPPPLEAASVVHAPQLPADEDAVMKRLAREKLEMEIEILRLRKRLLLKRFSKEEEIFKLRKRLLLKRLRKN